MDDSTKGRYEIILGIGLLNVLGLDLNFSNPLIVGVKGPYEGCLSHIVDIRNCKY